MGSVCCGVVVPIVLLVLTLVLTKFIINLLKLKHRKEASMATTNNVKISVITGLTTLVETLWAIGTSVAAAEVLC